MAGIELLEVYMDTSGPGLTRLLQPACQDGCLAHLARAFDKDDAVPPGDRLSKFPLDRAHDPEFGIEGHGPSDGFELFPDGKRPLRLGILQRLDDLLDKLGVL